MLVTNFERPLLHGERWGVKAVHPEGGVSKRWRGRRREDKRERDRERRRRKRKSSYLSKSQRTKSAIFFKKDEVSEKDALPNLLSKY